MKCTVKNYRHVPFGRLPLQLLAAVVWARPGDASGVVVMMAGLMMRVIVEEEEQQ